MKKAIALGITISSLFLGGCMVPIITPPVLPMPNYGPFVNAGTVAKLPASEKQDGFEFSAGRNQEGKIELYLSSAATGEVSRYVENGNGSFALEDIAAKFPAQHGHEGVAGARYDWNNDGAQDFLRMCANNGNVSLYSDKGKYGGYENIMHVTTLPNQPWDSPVAMDAADFLNIGTPDIVFAAARDPICCCKGVTAKPVANIKLYQNKGAGKFSYKKIIGSFTLPDLDTKFEIAAIDWDLDGDVDLLLKWSNKEDVILLENLSR